MIEPLPPRVVGFSADILLQPSTIFLYFLPMILFEHGYSLDKSHFFKNIRYPLIPLVLVPVLIIAFSTITIFAVFGTVIAAAFCALGIYYMGQVVEHARSHSLPSCAVLVLASAQHPLQIGLVHPLTPLYSAIFGAVMSAVNFEPQPHSASMI